jgi:hypothetical protein
LNSLALDHFKRRIENLLASNAVRRSKKHPRYLAAFYANCLHI